MLLASSFACLLVIACVLVFGYTNKLCTCVTDVMHLSSCIWVVLCLIDCASVHVSCSMWGILGSVAVFSGLLHMCLQVLVEITVFVVTCNASLFSQGYLLLCPCVHLCCW